MRLIDAYYLKNLPFERLIHTDFGDTAIPIEEVDNAPTVEYPEQITIKCDTEEDKQKLLSALRNAKLKVLVEERPQVKWIGKDGDFQCNKCYEKLWYRSDYCPQCGRRMEAEND